MEDNITNKNYSDFWNSSGADFRAAIRVLGFTMLLLKLLNLHTLLYQEQKGHIQPTVDRQFEILELKYFHTYKTLCCSFNFTEEFEAQNLANFKPPEL